MVNMLTLAYADMTEAQIHAIAGTPTERRHQLITDYVNSRFALDRLSSNSNRTQSPYSRERSHMWLAALARNLTHHQQTVFLLGRLQPDWLQTRWARWAVIVLPALIAALLIGAVGVGVAVSILFVLEVGLGIFLGSWLLSQAEPAERLSWSWAAARSRLRTALIVGLTCGLVAQVDVAWEGAGTVSRLIVVMSVGLSVGLGLALVSGLRGLSAGRDIGLAVGVTCALPTGIASGLIYASEYATSGGVGAELSSVMTTGMRVGILSGLGAGLIGEPHLVERLSWSSTQARSQLPTALVIGCTAGLLAGLTSDDGSFMPGPALGWSLGIGLGVALVGGLQQGLIPLYVSPNEGVRRSTRSGFIVAAISALGVGAFLMIASIVAVGADAISWGFLTQRIVVVLAAWIGLILGLIYGLGAVAQHGLLRVLLAIYHLAPLRYVRWLDNAVRLRLLYRSADGGYMFIHQMVQQHFSDLSKGPL
jgi:hypothetical protein